ncbi:Superoxide dismutase [Candidatus Ornithobacterium hominis]|uniref:superoxide dismutase n=1 Tax=Candidatus Ornithobacterium hominis TaxID=2497989 RepID=UPI0024BC5DE6|nr:superoxide dismutase [Candidatus Ornithobacterium hominis]CAI9428644.1 Superoxide dismutase [Candidatus Ornithobacterium hominis]
MAFDLPKLNYAFDALEPYIDAKTMEIHHDKHHGGYTDKLNAAIEGTELEGKSIEEILVQGFEKDAVRNNGGGFYNHSLFWEILSPNGGGKPEGELLKAIEDAFGSFEKFIEAFEEKAKGQFGSGWAWLCVMDGKELMVCNTANQDNPLMPNGCGGTPILGIDVWEHAYYLNYQNKRPDYVSAFWNVVNWDQVAKNFEDAKK